MSNNATLKCLLVPDLHAPYHSRKAYGCLLDVARRWRPAVCVVLGDFVDFAAVSSHPKDPRHTLPLAAEVDGGRSALGLLDRALGRRCTRWYLEGNHETRLHRYLQRQAPEVLDFVDWRSMLELDRRRWQVVPYQRSLQLGKLRMSHDVGRAGVNAARQSLLDVGRSFAFGHTHRAQVVYQGQLSGGSHVGATLGWLGDPELIDYRHQDLARRDWQHGFGAVHFLGSGEFWLQFVPIVAGRCVLDGVVYSA